MNGVSRQGAALLDKTTGALDPTFDPNTDGRVNTVAINPAGTKLYLAGNFQNVGSDSRPWIAEVSPTTGAAQGPTFTTVQDYVRDVTVGPDGSSTPRSAGSRTAPTRSTRRRASRSGAARQR